MLYGRKWWVFLVRGVLAIFFGVLCFAMPGMSMALLLGLIAAYWLLDGITALFATERAAREHQPWGWLTFEGIISLAAAVGTWYFPAMTALALLFVIAFWAIVTGIFKIISAVRLRKEIHDEWLLGTSGILSVIFGVVLIARPAAGALAFIWVIGAYAIVFGGLLIGLGFRLHHLLPRIDREVPA